MAQVAELRQWRHHHYSLVVRQGMKLCFTVVGQAQLFVVYILATSKVTAEWVPTCDSEHSWWFYSAASLGHQTVSTMTSQSHYPDTEPTRPCPILIMPNAMLGRQVSIIKSHWFDATRVQTLKVQIWKARDSDFPIAQNGRWKFYSFIHPDWFVINCSLCMLYVCSLGLQIP